MKSWGDLSWREKCNIREGNVNSFNYLTGYTFQVKQEVVRGKEKEENEETNQKTEIQ